MSRNVIQTYQLHDREVKHIKRGKQILEEDVFHRRTQMPKAGTWIRLADKRNRYVAMGLADQDKRPFCRAVLFDGGRDGPPDSDFFVERVREARDHRERLFRDEPHDVFRVVNAEGDGIPGLVIDKYGDFGVAWVQTPGLRTIARPVYDAVIDLYSLEGLYEKGPPRAGFHPDKDGRDHPFLGEAATDALVVREGGMRLEARLNEGPRTGVYPDQRDNRRLLAPLVKGRRVLNTFSYTGAFSVSAALEGAAETVSVDLSRRALDWSKRNFELNGIDLENHLHVKADTLDYLNLARRKKYTYDLIIHDPPTFSTAGKNTFRANRDWPRMLKASLDILEPGGWLACSSNTRSLSESEILRFIKEAAEQKRRDLKIEEVGGVPRDFPTHPQLPEMDYLKFVLARVE